MQMADIDLVLGIMHQNQHNNSSHDPGGQGSHSDSGRPHMQNKDGIGVAADIDDVHEQGGIHGNLGIAHGTIEGCAGIIEGDEGIGESRDPKIGDGVFHHVGVNGAEG